MLCVDTTGDDQPVAVSHAGTTRRQITIYGWSTSRGWRTWSYAATRGAMIWGHARSFLLQPKLRQH